MDAFLEALFDALVQREILSFFRNVRQVVISIASRFGLVVVTDEAVPHVVVVRDELIDRVLHQVDPDDLFLLACITRNCSIKRV